MRTCMHTYIPYHTLPCQVRCVGILPLQNRTSLYWRTLLNMLYRINIKYYANNMYRELLIVYSDTSSGCCWCCRFCWRGRHNRAFIDRIWRKYTPVTTAQAHKNKKYAWNILVQLNLISINSNIWINSKILVVILPVDNSSFLDNDCPTAEQLCTKRDLCSVQKVPLHLLHWNGRSEHFNSLLLLLKT